MSKAKSPARTAAAPPAPPVAEASTDQGTYGIYNLSDIRKSPTNRKRFNEVALQQLAANIKEMGVVQPILIRPVTPTAEQPEPYELVAGERRWRASGIAEVETIPAMCRTLSDKQAAEIQILENLQREDPHPLEEAEGYEQLMMNHGYNADQLADKIKKSRAYIYGRLKLCALTSEAREKFLNDEISASTALLIARIPVPALQSRALTEITQTSHFQPEPMSYRRAQQHIQGRYTLDLASANFDVGDAKLLAAAGSCTKCPKRSGNQPLVFADIKSADVCTDPDCFSEKRAAQYAKVIVIANKTGVPVIEGDEAEKITLHGRGTEFVAGNTSLWHFDRNAPSTGNAGRAEDYIGKNNMPKPAKYLKNGAGIVTPIYDRAAVQAALEKAGACETIAAHATRMQEQKVDEKEGSDTPSPRDIVRDANELKAAKITKQRVALYRELRSRAAAGFSLGSLREFTKDALGEFNLPRQLADVYPFEIRDDEAACAHIDQAPLEEVQLLLVDLMLGNYLEVAGWQVAHSHVGADDDGFNTIVRMAKHEGIDPEEVTRKFELSNTPTAAVSREDFTDLIRLMPERLADLTAVVMDTQPHNITALERAANANGYTWSKWQTPTPGSAWTKDAGSVIEIAQPAAKQTESQGVPEAAEVGAGDYVDPADFEQTPPAVKKPTSKAKTAKPKATAPASVKPWPWPTSAIVGTAETKSKTTEKEAA